MVDKIAPEETGAKRGGHNKETIMMNIKYQQRVVGCVLIIKDLFGNLKTG